jgi:hypothetical protein
MIQDFDSRRCALAALLIGVLLAASLSVAGGSVKKRLLADVAGRIYGFWGEPTARPRVTLLLIINPLL